LRFLIRFAIELSSRVKSQLNARTNQAREAKRKWKKTKNKEAEEDIVRMLWKKIQAGRPGADMFRPPVSEHFHLAADTLVLHPEKTRLVDATVRGLGFDFLGYHFERGTRWPRRKSSKKLKDNLRAKTKRCNGNSLAAIIDDVNSTLHGWFEYFKHCNRWTFPAVDGWVRRRLRSILPKRSKRRGISRGRDHNRWPNRFFRDHGLFSLEAAHRALLQSSSG
jgi:hypothetical protein